LQPPERQVLETLITTNRAQTSHLASETWLTGIATAIGITSGAGTVGNIVTIGGTTERRAAAITINGIILGIGTRVGATGMIIAGKSSSTF
jgi:hypothetical protein